MFYNMLLVSLKENSHFYLSESINTRCRLLQYKWLFRTYITPVKLHHFNPNIPDICTKCNNGIGTLFHCTWECQKLQIYWREVLDLVSELTGVAVPAKAELCLLHIYPEDCLINAKKPKLSNFCLLQANEVDKKDRLLSV